ncbi:hypothetical protein [Massilia sp.]|uniref:hypothetical protein n=1 Tax=Massilia sp. TaxID=1882437 RepID=UPI00289CFDFD|nr:hypothetical protein [Massilia sp.]
MTDMNTEAAGEAAQRIIPALPGGGSWRFDEAAWQWIPHDPASANERAELIPPTEPVTQE